MRIGIYGGSFNPVHYGHLGLAQWVMEHTDLDQVWLLVSPHNPLKQAEGLSDEDVRLREVAEAISRLETTSPELAGKIVASDFEFSLPRPTYTAATLRALISAYPEHQFTLIIGQDNLDCWDRWREHEWIADHFRIFVYPRSGSTGATPDEPKDANACGFHLLTEAPLFPISSTQIRAARAQSN